MQGKKFGWYMFVLILGAVVGSVLGDAFGVMLPPGILKTMLLKSASFGLPTTAFNLKVLTVTFGFNISINIMGVVGIFLIAYILSRIEGK